MAHRSSNLFDKWPYVPQVYPDELLYSFLARILRHVGSADLKLPGNLDGGRKHFANAVSSDLPVRIGLISENFSNEILSNPEHLLDNMTLYPYYGFCLTKERYDRVKMHAIHGTESVVGRLPQYTRGLRNNRFEYLKFCQKCNKDAKEKFGEYFWKRSHQVPYVDICVLHGDVLRLSTVKYRSASGHYFAATEASCPEDGRKSVDLYCMDDYNEMLDLSIASLDILNEQKVIDIDALRNARLRVLAQFGFTSRKNLVRHDKIAEQVNAVLRTLVRIYPELALTPSHTSWLSKLLHKCGSSSAPVHHILFEKFSKYLNDKCPVKTNYLQKPFGHGPWPCPNRLTCGPKRENVRLVSVSLSHGRYLGRFRCDCGFIYTISKNEYGEVTKRTNIYVGHEVEDFLRGEKLPSIVEILRQIPISKPTLYKVKRSLGLS